MASSRSFILAALVLLLAGCMPRESVKKEKMVPPSESPAAASFTIPNLAEGGGNISLSAFAGQVVLLDFWATWCPPCRYELPGLNALYRELKDKGFTIIGMTVDQGAPDKVAQAVKKFNLTYPVGLAGSDAQQAYGGIRAVPSKFLLDKNGKVRQSYVGVVQEAQLKADVEALLAE